MNIRNLIGEDYAEKLDRCNTAEDFFEIIKQKKLPFSFEQSKNMFEMWKKEKTRSLQQDDLEEIVAGQKQAAEIKAYNNCRLKIICRDFAEWHDNGYYKEGTPKSCLTCIHSQVVPYLT